MSTALADLRSSIIAKSPITLLDAAGTAIDDISLATTIVLGEKQYNLHQETIKINNKDLPLQAFYNVWVMRDFSTADYISQSQSKNIPTISFHNKSELIKYFDGQSTTFLDSSSVVSSSTTAPVKIKTDEAEEDKKKQENYVGSGAAAATAAAGEVSNSNNNNKNNNNNNNIASNELEVPLLHDNLFQGVKSINFEYLVKEAELKIVKPLKSKSSHGGKIGKPDKANGGGKKVDNPIILLSPATSALIQMSNIKEFLENGVFKEPNAASSQSTGTNLIRIKKVFPNLGPQQFLIVNSTDFFTKMEYWDRVVAIFTTGQLWQFKNYSIKDPEKLFQKFKGYYFGYEGALMNKNAQDWNVEVVKIDRNRRFNDKEISEQFWRSLERSMMIQGFRKN
ncbi:Cdc73 protein [Saccharomycopsis crataegensis]|uniref:Cdc73 protein n=1 Tax=Saccharomycopsis crataegensis TaxID=43959 RepID=A0AAV5QFP8_9ASCO|nr:Cdc73 protein [Saccharomycopsis crataegensis]